MGNAFFGKAISHADAEHGKHQQRRYGHRDWHLPKPGGKQAVCGLWRRTDMEYAQNELDALDLAYATTVHKSQGSEYDTVILSLQTAHYIMLRRPLLYTAITRAKRHVIIVGERKALVIASGGPTQRNAVLCSQNA